jgi:hypothetical protein
MFSLSLWERDRVRGAVIIKLQKKHFLVIIYIK